MSKYVLRQWVFVCINFFLRVYYWFQGYTWADARFKVFTYRVRQAIAKTDFHVFRTNREL